MIRDRKLLALLTAATLATFAALVFLDGTRGEEAAGVAPEAA